MKQEFSLFFNFAFMALFCLFLTKLFQFLYNFFIFPLFSPLRKLPGPRSKGWYSGWTTSETFMELSDAVLQNHKKYGNVFYGIQYGRKSSIYIIDEEAYNYVFTNQYSINLKNQKVELFRKSDEATLAATETVGSTVIGVQTEIHKRHRKAFLPAFNDSAVRQASCAMIEITKKMIKVIKNDIVLQKDDDQNQGYCQIDFLHYSREMALDLIGMIGFNEDLGGLKKEKVKLFIDFQGLLDIVFFPSFYMNLRFHYPFLGFFTKYFLQEEKKFRKNKKGVQEQSEKIITTSQWKNSSDFKTILHLTKRQNSKFDPTPPTSSLSSNSYFLTDVEIRDSIATLLMAGSESSATSVSWSIYELTKDKNGISIQSLLRQELKDEINQGWKNDFTILNNLPFLDSICKEILRLHPALGLHERMCFQDTIIPFGTPIKLRDGKMINKIPIKKGEMVYFSITGANTSETFWGKDAKKFLPQRWLKEDHPLYDAEIANQLTEKGRKLGGWNHTLSFGQGVRMCIGFRFALAEVKIVLAHCIDQFEWKAAIDPNTEKPFIIESRGQRLNKPGIKGTNKSQFSLPISVKSI